jgi:hypothetical protein
VQTYSGTWATVAMGHLDQPLNTFWQLFFRPAGSAEWSDQVQATAAATNGGLILASSHGRALLVGVRPSNLLTFSPLISTADGGRSWSTGLLTEELAARPDALAANSSSQTLALVDAGGTSQVLESAHGISTWRTSTTTRALASTAAGRSCGLGSITTVAYLTGKALVGASCSHPGVVGIFAERAAGWHLIEAVLPGSLDHARVEVLALQPTSEGVCALLGISGQTGISLVAAWQENGHWSSSQPLHVAGSEHVSSSGPSTGNGIFVLLTGSSGAQRLVAVSSPSAGWQQLSPPPAGTATVAFDTASSVDALAVRDTVLSVWSLTSHARHWVRGQVINVPIEFGSSE